MGQSNHLRWRQQLTKKSSGFTNLELVGDLVLLLTEAECLIAVELYLADTTAGDNNG